MTQDGVYWLFTSSAQTVAAFVGFLLAGFTLALGMLDDAAERDATLIEVVTALKAGYHTRLRSLSEMTAVSIVTDLLIVLLQGSGTAYHGALLGIGFLLNVVTVVLAVYFVVTSVDPQRIPRAAQRLLAQEPKHAGGASIGEFTEAFVPIERRVRNLAERADLASPIERPESLGRLVRLLLSRQRLAPSVAHRIDELARYRNLVVHGQADSVDPRMVQEARDILGLLSNHPEGIEE